MQAAHEIGIGKMIRFLWGLVFSFLFELAFLPQLRVIVLRLFGAYVGKSVVAYNIKFFNLYYKGLSNLSIGGYGFIGSEVMIDMADSVCLGDHVTLSNRAFLLTHTNVGYKNHPLQVHYPRFTKPITIKDGAFVGVGAIIMPGVTLGSSSVVGAGSVVTHDVKDNAVVAGVPARVIKQLKPNKGKKS